MPKTIKKTKLEKKKKIKLQLHKKTAYISNLLLPNHSTWSLIHHSCSTGHPKIKTVELGRWSIL